MMTQEVKVNTSAHGATLLVPEGYDQTSCIVTPHLSTDDRWDARVQKNARVVLCEQDIHASEIIVEEGAQLDLISVQVIEHPSKLAVEKTIIVHQNAIVRVFTGLFDSIAVKIVGELRGDHSVFENHVMYFGSARQSIGMELNAEHSGKQTMSRILVRGVAVESAHANFSGSINIHQTGSGTDGYLAHDGLLLSKKARIDSLPGLEIGTDDVKAQHSSAIHYIRPEQIFYLQTRGMGTLEAKKMIVTGFLEEMLATVREKEMLSRVHNLIEVKKELMEA